MNIDLTDKTVTFSFAETLTLEQLRLLVELLEDGEPEEDFDTPPLAVELVRVFHTMSDTTLKIYTIVRLSHGEWACSCPDWVYRKSLKGGWCKHIHRLYEAL